MADTTINRSALPTHSFDWGAIKWLVSPSTTQGAQMTFGEVLLLPGKGHERHNHPGAEEVLYILSGEAEQMVNDEDPFPVRAGDVLYIPTGAFHSTINTGWEPVRLIAVYNPGGSELGLAELPDHQETPAGETLGLVRAACPRGTGAGPRAGPAWSRWPFGLIPGTTPRPS